MSTEQPAEGEKDMVTEVLSKVIVEISPLIEGKFLYGFNVDFEIDGMLFNLSLARKR